MNPVLLQSEHSILALPPRQHIYTAAKNTDYRTHCSVNTRLIVGCCGQFGCYCILLGQIAHRPSPGCCADVTAGTTCSSLCLSEQCTKTLSDISRQVLKMETSEFTGVLKGLLCRRSQGQVQGSSHGSVGTRAHKLRSRTIALDTESKIFFFIVLFLIEPRAKRDHDLEHKTLSW